MTHSFFIQRMSDGTNNENKKITMIQQMHNPGSQSKENNEEDTKIALFSNDNTGTDNGINHIPTKEISDSNGHQNHDEGNIDDDGDDVNKRGEHEKDTVHHQQCTTNNGDDHHNEISEDAESTSTEEVEEERNLHMDLIPSPPRKRGVYYEKMHHHQPLHHEEDIPQHEYPSIPFTQIQQQRHHHQHHSQQQHQHLPQSQKSIFQGAKPSLDQFFYYNQQPKVKYYRIVYKGFVALLNDPELQSKKNGAYVSYGEIIASTHEMEIQIPCDGKKHGNDNPIIELSSSVMNQHDKHHHQQQRQFIHNNNNNKNNNSSNSGGLSQISPVAAAAADAASVISSSIASLSVATSTNASSSTTTSLPIVPTTSFGAQRKQYQKQQQQQQQRYQQYQSVSLSSPTRKSTMGQIMNETDDDDDDRTVPTSPSRRRRPQQPISPQNRRFLDHHHYNDNNDTSTTTTIRIIQVDDVLTGGYAIDALSKGTSHTHNTPRRSNAKNVPHGIGGGSVPNCTTTKSVSSADNCNNSSNNNNNNIMGVGGGSVSSGGGTGDNGSNTSGNSSNHHINHHMYSIIPGGIDRGGLRDDRVGFGRGVGGSKVSRIGSIDEDSTASDEKQHHGYIFASRNGMQITEFIPAPPLLCQPGPFYYRVVSSFPLPILAGPCADAPTTRAMALPGTVHEISLRMGSVHGNGGSNHSSPTNSPGRGGSGMGGNIGLEDGVVYLRLSHRRGWIADRRYIMIPSTPSYQDDLDQNYNTLSSSPPSSPRNSPNRSRGHRRSGSGGSSSRQRRCIELVMKEVSDYVDVSNFGINDDISLGGTSISSASIATPASVIRTRRRPVRRRNDRNIRHDSRSGMVVQPKAKRKGRSHGKGKHHAVETGIGALSSPISDVSLYSDLSNKNNTVHEMEGNSETHENPSNVGRKEVKPNVFLLRVTAPNGLKILDAPHFQVNNLIRGQTNANTTPYMKTNNSSSSDVSVTKSVTTTSTVNPSSIFHTMKGSLHDGTHGWELDASGKKRVLPRGVLFEASNRMERTGTFSHGCGLIKLADGTGWAIVPNKDDLLEQYSTIQGAANKNLSEIESMKGFEEVGNAVTSKGNQSFDMLDDDFETVWVRVVQGTGVLVSCAPSPITHKEHRRGKQNSPISSTYSSDSSHSRGSIQPDSDASSAVTGVFGAFRHTKKTEVRVDNMSVVGIDKKANRKANKVNLIPCGTCVQVDRWIPSKSHPERQSFVRIYGGQGWIPRAFHGSLYSVDIRTPDIRQGSFWFRVQSMDGMTVRTGPSKRARPFKSSKDGSYFRFECGEFLRVSEILTIHGHADVDEKETDHGEPITHPSESFAKLYRNKSSNQQKQQQQQQQQQQQLLQQQNSNTNKKEFVPLSSYTSPGEWVHVHCNGNLYLEECVNPPRIKRDHDGWRYEVVHETGVEIRKGPSFLSKKANGQTLQCNASILINEEVTADGETVTWLRLKDGRGFVNTLDENGVLIVKKKESTFSSNNKKNGNGNDGSYKLIARLFNNPGESS